MNAKDFYFDNQYLSDYGFLICKITSSNSGVTVEEGQKLTFNKRQKSGSNTYTLASANYSTCYTTTFEICKNPDVNDTLIISQDEFRDIMRWLNRREYLPFYFIPYDRNLNKIIIDVELKIKALKEKEITPAIESKIKTLNEKLYSLKAKRDSLESETKYYNASFNVQKIYVGKNLIGISVTMETDSPVGYGQTQTYRYTVTDQKKEFLLSDVSDEIGCIYPDLKIVIDRPGDLTISNTTFNTTTIIKNCKVDETITIKGDTQIIQTDSDEHKQTLTKDFNFEFLKIGNTIKSRQNRITFSLPCKVELTYTPSIK